MRKMIRLIIYMFIVFAMVNSNKSIEASASGEDFEMYINNLVRYHGDAETVIIPEDVIFIDEYAFAWNDKVSKIVIPNTVRRIEDSAFYACTALKEIIIPDRVDVISDSAFAYCTSLERIVIPESVWSLGNNVFSNCISLTSVTMDTYNITDWMFAGCEKLKNIDMEDISEIGEGGFYGCTGLKNINLDWVKTIGPRAFENCSSLNNIELLSIEDISDRTFYGCSSLSNIKFNEYIRSIGKDAFTETPWLSISKNKSPYIIVNGVLVDATLASGLVTLPKEVKIISRYASYENSFLTGLIIPNKTSLISDLAFAYCEELIAVYIPEQVKEIGDKAFYKCSKLEAIYGRAGSYAEEYANKAGITFVSASSESMKKAVKAAKNEKATDTVLYEDFIAEVGSSGYFDIENSIKKAYKNCRFESLAKSVISVNKEGYYNLMSKGNALVLLKGTINNKSTIIKVIRVSGIQSTLLPKKISHLNHVLGLADGGLVVSDLITDDYSVPHKVKLRCYDDKGKELWSYGLDSRAEDENSSVSFETFYNVKCDKLMELSDGNILAIGSGRGRLTSKANSQYNIVTASWITKIDSKTGRVIWEELMEAVDSCHFFTDAVEKEDGTILIYENVFSGGYDIIHLDPNGNVLSKNNYTIMSQNALVTMNMIYSDDGRIITVGNISGATFRIFSIDKNGEEAIEAAIIVEETSPGGTIGDAAPRILKGNHKDYYVYFWAKPAMVMLYHLDSGFQVIHSKELDIGMIQNAYITPEDKIVFVGNEDKYVRNGKILIYDCVSEKTTSVLLSSYSENYSNSPMVYGDIIGNDGIVAAGTNYYDKKTYLYQIDDIHFMSSTVDVQSLKINKINNQKYTGKALKPNITIKNGNKKLVLGKDYKVAYQNNKKKGSATAIIYGINGYTGAQLISFKIV